MRTADKSIGEDVLDQLIRSLDDLLGVRHPLEQRRRVEDNGSLPLSRVLAELGLSQLSLGPEIGGLGGTPEELARVMQALGRGLARDPAPIATAAAALMMKEARADWRSADVEAALVGLTPILLQASGLTASIDGDRWILEGEATTAFAGEAPTTLLIAVNDGSDDVMLRVCVDTPGLHRVYADLIDHSRVVTFRFADVPVPADACLARGNRVVSAHQAAFDLSAVLKCAEVLGCMAAMIDQTAAFVGTRHQFGGPIGRFQVIQHRLADLWMSHKLASALVRGALSAMSASPLERRRAVLAAQALIIQAGREVLEDAIQLHGAMGLTEALAVGLYAKRILVLTADAEFGADTLTRYAELTDALEGARD